MGWSHGGYITLFSVFRDETPFKAAAAIVPVTNLVFRLSYKGPTYQDDFATQERIQGLPFEKRDEYIKRSPLYHADRLSKPVIFFQGEEDAIVPPNQAEAMVEALRCKGNPIGYFLFSGEQHGFRKAGNIQRCLDAELYFYATDVFRTGLTF